MNEKINHNKKFTKKFRIQLYKEALEYLENAPNTKSICGSIARTLGKHGIDIFSSKLNPHRDSIYFRMEARYPELWKYRPEGVVKENVFWFPDGADSKEKRIEILKNVIKDLEG